MSLMGFLSSPLGTIVSSTAENIGERYFQVVEKNTDAEVQNIIDVIKATKKAKDAAVSTGSALNSQFAAQATALSTVEGFENASQADLIATIKSVEDAGLAKKGEAVKYIMENPSAYTIDVKPKGKSAITQSAQTQELLFAGGPKITTKPTKERGLIQQLLHGPGIEEIRDIALSKIGMTREEYNALMSPVVRKKLNIGESTIKFSIQNKLNPLVVATNKERQVRFETAMGNVSNENMETILPAINMSISDAQDKFNELIFEDPTNPEISKILSSVIGFVSGNASAQKIIQNDNPIIDRTIEFMNNDKINFESKAQAKILLEELTGIHKKITNNAGALPQNLISEKLDIINDLKVVLGKNEVVLDAALTTYIKELENSNIPSSQLIDGIGAGKLKVDILTDVNEFRSKLLTKNMSQDEILKERNSLKERILKYLNAPQIVVPSRVENVISQLDEFVKNGKLNLNQTYKTHDGDGNLIEVSANKQFNSVLKPLADQITNNLFPKGGSMDVALQQFDTIATQLYSLMDTSPTKESEAANLIKTMEGRTFNIINGEQYSPIIKDAVKALNDQIAQLMLNSEKIPEQTLRNKAELINRTLTDIITNVNNTETHATNILNRINTIVNNAVNNNANKFNKDDIVKMLSIQRTATDLLRTFQNNVNNLQGEELTKANNEVLAALIEAETSFVDIAQLNSTQIREKTDNEINTDNVVNYVNLIRKNNNLPSLTTKEEEELRIKTMFELENNQIYMIDKVPHKVLIDSDGNITMQQVTETLPSGKVKQFREVEISGKGGKIEKLKGQIDSSDNISKVILAYFKEPTFANAVGKGFFFLTDLKDAALNLVGKESSGEILGFDAVAAQEGITAAINNLGSVKDLIFDDPRLSDQDLRIVQDYNIASKQSGLISDKRALAGLGLIHSMQLQKAILNSFDIDQEEVKPLIERHVDVSAASYENMNLDEKAIYQLERELGFSISSGKPNHTKDIFSMLTLQMGFEVLNAEQIVKLSGAEYRIDENGAPVVAKGWENGEGMTEEGKKAVALYHAKKDYIINTMHKATSQLEIYSIVGQNERNNVESLYLNKVQLNSETGAPVIFDDTDINWAELRYMQ